MKATPWSLTAMLRRVKQSDFSPMHQKHLARAEAVGRWSANTSRQRKHSTNMLRKNGASL
jgi:hypothetical protein